MNTIIIVFGIVVLLVVMGGVALLLFVRRSGPSRQEQERIRRAWAHVARQQDPVMRVLEAEKVFALLLSSWVGKGTVADGLKKAGWRFADPEALWRAHKLRNRIAHETGLQVPLEEAERAVRTFRKAIERHIGEL